MQVKSFIVSGLMESFSAIREIQILLYASLLTHSVAFNNKKSYISCMRQGEQDAVRLHVILDQTDQPLLPGD